MQHSQEAHLKVIDYMDFGLDYALTLQLWREKFESQLAQIRAQGFDESFIRIWRFYYWYCEAGFLTQRTSVCHLTLTRE